VLEGRDHMGLALDLGKNMAEAVATSYRETLSGAALEEFNIRWSTQASRVILNRATELRRQREAELARRPGGVPSGLPQLPGMPEAAAAGMTVAEKGAERLTTAADRMGDAFGDAFADVLEGTSTIKEAFMDMVRAIQRTLIEELIARPIAQMISGTIRQGLGLIGVGGVGAAGAAGAAGGAALAAAGPALTGSAGALTGSAGALTAAAGALQAGAAIGLAGSVPIPVAAATTPMTLAAGGIVSTPASLLFANKRVGTIGEAGPEAVLPLARTAGGDLGVQIAGGDRGRNITINMVIATPDAQAFRRSRRQIMAEVKSAAGGF